MVSGVEDNREGVIQSPPGRDTPGDDPDTETAREGRPPHEPTEESRAQVSKMSAYHIKQEVIAEIVGISPHTLRKHYAFELQCGRAQVVVRVADSLIEKAISDRPDAVNAAKFVLGSEPGWAERKEISGPDGGPIETKETGGRDLARRIAFALVTGVAAAEADDES